MWKQQKNIKVYSCTLIFLYLCFAFEVKAQEKAKYIGIGMYIGPHAVNFMRGKGFETSYWSDAHYVNTYYEQAKRRLKFHLQREFFGEEERKNDFFGSSTSFFTPYNTKVLNTGCFP